MSSKLHFLLLLELVFCLFLGRLELELLSEGRFRALSLAVEEEVSAPSSCLLDSLYTTGLAPFSDCSSVIVWSALCTDPVSLRDSSINGANKSDRMVLYLELPTIYCNSS